ncbi:MAG TPA: TonB-dependent receptor [Lunatimonas sp.]|nr:TonB-dependent receptor [Lunatimonas sp.]
MKKKLHPVLFEKERSWIYLFFLLTIPFFSMANESEVLVFQSLSMNYRFLAETDLKLSILPSPDISENNSKVVLDISISGTVVDQNGEPIPGVSVSVEGSNLGTVTDINGKYVISVPDGSTVIFSFIGFNTQRVQVGTQNVIDVTLTEEMASLDEFVVVGYGTVRKSDITGAVASVSKDKINEFASANVMQAIAGRASGIQVKQNNGRPGAPISVRIRGTNSIVGNNEPLYVVDGFPVSNPLSINNSSIESIEILKDASAVAIYGSRASNGVVLITTKRGRVGETSVNIETNYGFQQVIKKMEMMNPLEFGIYYNRLDNNMNRGDRFSQQQLDEFATMGEGTIWQDVVFQTAPMQNHSVNVSGGTEKTKFSVTGGLFDQQGIINNSDFKRYSFNANIRHDIDKKFSFETTITLSKNKSARQLSEQGRFGTSLIGRAYGIPNYLGVYEEDGSYLEPVLRDSRVSEALWNPLNFINETSNILGENNVLGNLAAYYKIIDGLELKISGGIESINSRTDIYQTKKFQNVPDGVASVNVSEFTSLLNENILSYNKNFGERHSVSAVTGFTYQNFLTTSLSGGGRNFLSDVTETHNLATAAIPSIPGSGYSQSTLLSGLGRVNYSFDNRYLFTISYRADGSSVYSPGNKWGYFPSAAFSWRLSEEGFFNVNRDVINDLRLRTSWGKAGSQAISPYATMNQLFPGTTVFGSALFTTMAPSVRLASDLKWETTEQLNIGLEMSFLQGRLQLTTDYYIKETSDLLNAVQLARSTGYTNSLRNIGRVSNKGIEFQVNASIFEKNNFNWEVDANISFNRSKVLDLYGGQDILAGQLQMIMFTDFANTYREGEPLGIMFGYVEADEYTENGFLQYVDQNGDGVIDAKDKVQIGDPNPNYIFGLNSKMSFSNFTFSIFLTGTQGNNIINMSAVAYTMDQTNGTNKLKEVLNNHWTPEKPDAKYPIPSTNNRFLFSDRYVEDGSFVRLRNIELGYNLPVHKWTRMKNAQIYFSGQNLLTFTNYSWLDPDVNTRGGSNSLDQGIDYAGYPAMKSYTFGARIGF